MTARLPLLALLSALALAMAPLSASADVPAKGAGPDSSASASGSVEACPAPPGGVVAADAELRRIREQLALQQAGSLDPQSETLNGRGYNYGGDGGAVRVPGVAIPATAPR